MRVPFNDLARADGAAAAAAVQRVIERGWYLLGEETEGFERELAAYLGVGDVVTVASGTDALVLALAALGTSAGDEVVTAANAGGYTTNAALQRGMVPRYADVEEDNLLMSRKTVEAALGPRTAAVVVTHLYGKMAPIESIRDLCDERGVPLVEDCAQAAGARAAGGSAGSFGDAAAFSFYPTKNLGALGDGGAVATDRPEVAERVRRLRQYGWGSKYRVSERGGRNSRIDELQCAVLRGRLGALEAGNARRREVCGRYAEALAGTPVGMMHDGGSDFVGHLAVARTADRAAFAAALRERGVATDVHYPVPDHRQPALADPAVSLPVTERAADEVLSLPCFPELTDGEVDHVCAAIHDAARALS
jgi:dTDP-3-amino-2,3,6-trideoxy-4-keto-D-glucose/dTDP-3-amino-3,4,6-trideoxy-alpha-D-glucose/dTDP-2,6-dideoxy-D-kanosamine transaminase